LMYLIQNKVGIDIDSLLMIYRCNYLNLYNFHFLNILMDL
jgi:hypothetical protein